MGCNSKDSSQKSTEQKPTKPLLEQYVSLECQAGDITLTLHNDHTFDLNIQLWNEETQEHIGEENIEGNWEKSERELTLTTSENQIIVYTLSTERLKIKDRELDAVSYQFKSNTKNFFGTHFNLLDKNQTDAFFKEVISK